LHKKKYVVELEKRLANLQLENKELQKQCNMYKEQNARRHQAIMEGKANQRENQPRPEIDDRSMMSLKGPIPT
jgi:predicted ATP-grasp superfamily ATP-dependent carboligase